MCALCITLLSGCTCTHPCHAFCVVQGAPHPPISGPGAVGWRIQLYWGADQAWHEADVLSHDEVGSEVI